MPGRGQPWKEGGHVDSTITGDDVKDSSIEGKDLDFFKSAPVPMTGSPVPFPHGLGRVPPKVTISILTGPAGYIPPAIVLVGVDATDVIVTGSPGWIVEIMAQ